MRKFLSVLRFNVAPYFDLETNYFNFNTSLKMAFLELLLLAACYMWELITG